MAFSLFFRTFVVSLWRRTAPPENRIDNDSDTMENNKYKTSQYACAVLLIVSSIALVAYQVVEIDNVASGLLYYVAQSFLLAGSIFGLDQYVRIISQCYRK